MRRFHFRLETLLSLRKRKEDEVKQELGKKNHEILAARQELAALTGALAGLQATEKKRRVSGASAVELRYSVAYRFKLTGDILEKGRAVDDLQAQALAIRKKLVKAKQDRRAIEIVRERQWNEWHKEYRTREQGFSDDVSQQGYIRRTGAAAHSAA